MKSTEKQAKYFAPKWLRCFIYLHHNMNQKSSFNRRYLKGNAFKS